MGSANQQFIGANSAGSTSDLNYAELGRHTGISRAQIQRILKGRRQPSWEVACRLADTLGITLDELRLKVLPSDSLLC